MGAPPAPIFRPGPPALARREPWSQPDPWRGAAASPQPPFCVRGLPFCSAPHSVSVVSPWPHHTWRGPVCCGRMGAAVLGPCCAPRLPVPPHNPPAGPSPCQHPQKYIDISKVTKPFCDRSPGGRLSSKWWWCCELVFVKMLLFPLFVVEVL